MENAYDYYDLRDKFNALTDYISGAISEYTAKTYDTNYNIKSDDAYITLQELAKLQDALLKAWEK